MARSRPINRTWNLFDRKKALPSVLDLGGEGMPGGGDGPMKVHDPYRVHAWVNIAISILIRNIARATFLVVLDGKPVDSGRVFQLFRDVNSRMNRFDLWKETAGWWFLEGEAFWFFGDGYAAGLPRELYVLNPRRMMAYAPFGTVEKWFYVTTKRTVPILPDEVIHFREWNPWNEIRGVNPLIALGEEIEQDVRSNRSTTKLMGNNSIPDGVLKTDQVLREDEAEQLEERWESIYGKGNSGRSIAVLGKGSEFQPLTFTPQAMRYLDLKRWNVHAILARYGIPPRVANIFDLHSSISGKDTREQHAAFWEFTIIPTLRNFEQILETQFFGRFGLRERGVFDVSGISELQESEAEKSRRDVAEINAGLKTINDVLRSRGEKEKSWGDTWYRPSKLVETKNGKN